LSCFYKEGKRLIVFQRIFFSKKKHKTDRNTNGHWKRIHHYAFILCSS